MLLPSGPQPARREEQDNPTLRCRVNIAWRRVAAARTKCVASRQVAVAALLFFVTLALARNTEAQGQGNVTLDANEQLFSVLAALNASGYDTGLGMDTGNNTREVVRTFLSKKKIPIEAEVQKFYEAHRIADDSGADLGQYVSLALLMSPPPDFKLTVPQKDLPPDAKRVAGLVPLLKTFAQQADLPDLWSRLQSRNQAEIARYSDDVRRSIALSDAYLRFPAGAYLGRTCAIYLDLLGSPEQVQARIYGSNYYLVVTPSKQSKVNEIRHQYLHFLLDPLALKYADEIHQQVELRAVARQAPMLAADFKEDFPLLVTECLIRAIELRLDKRPKPDAEKAVQELTATGLILTPYFYAALAGFEQQDGSMNTYYKQLILGIDPDEETKRLATVKFSLRPTAVDNKKAPPQTEEERSLSQAENLIYQGHYEEAKAAFKSLLEKLGPTNERALFGLAAAYTYTRKPDLAEEYFQKALDAAHDPRIATWSHIYLGRIYDLKGKRNDALAQYRAASLTATAYPEALRAVQTGLQEPYGSRKTEP